MVTAATTEKTKMQMPVTNQKTKSIRPASRDAGSGSQPGMSANAEATAPARTPIMISWTIEPLRTDAASLLQRYDWMRRVLTGSRGGTILHIPRGGIGVRGGIFLVFG